MTYWKKTLLAITACVAVVLGCATGKPAVNNNNTPTDPRWKAIDSLAEKGQFASALTATEKVLEAAQAEGDFRTEFRAWMYKARFQGYTDIDRKEILAPLEQRATAASDPVLAALLHSVVAQSYWDWYQDERWEVLQRTAVAEAGSDPDTWDQAAFMRKVIAEFAASVEPYDTLKQVPVGDLAGLLLPEERREDALRPTVYDVLAHRALDVFRNSETRLSEPAWRFRLDDPRYFALFEPFAHGVFAHRDSTAWEWQALQLYQRLEHAHLADTKADALVDVALERLQFVHERSTLAEKDSLHLQALTTLRSRLAKEACEAEVMVAIGRWHMEQGAKYQALAGDDRKNEKRTAAVLFEEAIAKWPRSYGAVQAKVLLHRLHMPALQLKAENAVPPDAPFLAALSYTNVPKVWLRVVKDPAENGRRDHYNDAYQDQLLKTAPLKAWEVGPIDDGDLNTHLTELPVEGLPLGRYVLIVSGDAAFAKRRSTVAFAPITVTALALITRNTPDGKGQVLVVDRSSGAPIAGAKAELSQEEWRNNGRVERSLGTAVTDADGIAAVALPQGHGGTRTWEVAVGADRITSAVYGWHNNDNDPAEEPRTFLFTDRAIYRPGQEIHYKGIVTVKNGNTTAVKADYVGTVRFTDMNGEKIAEHTLTTDAYGSFHGTFTAPQSVLAGSMTISEEHGSATIRVEEYKRPTFEVAFDPVTTAPKLEQEAKVSGVAKSYAGVPLDGAQVQWKVMREARLPWWCGWYWRSIIPWGQRTEVANGTTTTDGAGAFNVSFLAQADKAVARQADPTFVYTVEASVVDINGETQSGSTQLSVGYRSIDIDLQVGEAIDRRATDSLKVVVKNLNGQPMDVPMDIRIARLQAPAVPLRDHLWEQPDRPLLSAQEHATRFPGQVYAQEGDPLNWPEAATVLERTNWSAKGKALPLTGSKDWDVGTYLFSITAKDSEGKAVVARKAITVYDTTVRNTGFVQEAFHVEPVQVRAEPGEKAVLLLSSALPVANVLMEVERSGVVAVRRWFKLERTQQRIELPAMESDRGGFTVHFVCAERGRDHRESITIDVPWTNKELHVEWMTFRDKLLPGAKEEWRLRITGEKNTKVAAQLLTAMYDASLDHFVPHSWGLDIWNSNGSRLAWSNAVPFGQASSMNIWREVATPGDTAHVYPVLNTYGFQLGGENIILQEVAVGNVRSGAAHRVRTVACPSFDAVPGVQMKAEAMAAEPTGDTVEADAGVQGADVAQPVVRTDFRETAFFFPELQTDKDGAVILKFTMPEALTRWKLLGLAHTTDLKVGTFTKETITQKPLMVVPNLPRFLREGDRITLSSKINAIEGNVNGTAKLELFDPFTNAPLNNAFKLDNNSRAFTAAPGKSANVAWDLTVPEGVSMVSVRITAGSAGASDGEEKPLPILTDKVLVTESLPLWSSGKGTKTFTLDKLKNNTSTTLRTQQLKLEYTPNPAWYAVQALPYLMEYPHACAEQTFSRWYANTLAADIVAKRPRINEVFAQWKQAGPAAFASALEKNADLKSVVLEETPWVINARSERESKERIALLFDLQRMGAEQEAALKKLREMQLNNGAWPWWSGMRESRYITQHIVAGFGHLEKLGAADLRPDGQAQQMIKSAVRWLDGDIERDYKLLVRNSKKDELEKYVPGHHEIHYLYARSFFPRWAIDGATRTATDFYMKRLKATWLSNGLQQQAMIALAMHRLGDKETAQLIMKSLGERATRNEELGMYWKDFRGGIDWWSFPTETQALLIEAFQEVANDAASVNALRTHLLRLKQTTDWKTTKATSEACYALLLTGDDWLTDAAPPTITVGGAALSANDAQPGTGTFEHTWKPEDVKPAMAEVSITNTTDRASWGALHWQYLEQMDKVTPHESPFNIRKEVLLKRSGDGGTQLVPLKDQPLKAGDLLTIRIEVRTDRYVDYVHLKDLRAAGLEPTETLSGYRHQGGLGYYRTTRDASVNFFFDRIAPGTHVLEYDLRVSHPGDFSNGITTAMCMYAPEFSSHSAGVRIAVEK